MAHLPFLNDGCIPMFNEFVGDTNKADIWLCYMTVTDYALSLIAHNLYTEVQVACGNGNIRVLPRYEAKQKEFNSFAHLALKIKKALVSFRFGGL